MHRTAVKQQRTINGTENRGREGRGAFPVGPRAALRREPGAATRRSTQQNAAGRSTEPGLRQLAPAGNASVTLTARATTDCAAQHAACDASGRKFDGNLTATVTGPQAQQRAVPVVSIAAPATTPVTEGTALAFTLTRTGATDAALTVNVSVTESGATLDATPPTTTTFAAGSANATLSVPTVDDTTVEAASTVTATVTTGTGYTVATGASSAHGVVESEDLEPITATWSEIPTEHDGASAFWAKMTFSHALSGYSFRSMQSHLNPSASGRGLTASIAPEWGRSTSATDPLWSGADARTLTSGAQFEPTSRVVTHVGYGFGLGEGRGLLTPYTGATFGERGNRTARGGAKWQLGADFAVGIEASRTAEGGEPATHAISLQGTLRF